MKKSVFLGVGLLVLMVSCQGLFEEVKEKLTTAVASYIVNNAGGIDIKDFKGEITPEAVGLIAENGKTLKSFSFTKPTSDGVMTCNEVPVDFVKTNAKPGIRSVSASPYVGTWEAFIPLQDGFKRLFLDLKENAECAIYLEVLPKNDVEVKTHVETVLEGSVTQNANKYALTVSSTKGYGASLKRATATLEENSDVLTAVFNANGRAYRLEIFKLNNTEGTKKTYVGTGAFSKENVGTDITFVVDGSNFTLTVPNETKLPKNFNK
ncbi:MAG: hypothetical protein ACTTKH_06630 [Treponema sp.]